MFHEIAKCFVKADVKDSIINSKTNKGSTPLHIAAQQLWIDTSSSAQDVAAAEDVTLVQFLKRNGAVLDMPDELGMTSLHLAAKKGRCKCMHALLSMGASIDARDKLGNTALHVAAETSKRVAVRFLVKQGADRRSFKHVRNRNGKKAYELAKDAQTRAELENLWEACASGSIEHVRGYVQHALQVVQPLPWSPVKVEEKTPEKGRTALHLIVLGAGQLVNGMWDCGATVDPSDPSKMIYASVSSNNSLRRSLSNNDRAVDPFCTIMRYLLENDAFVDSLDKNCVTPLLLAAREGITPLIRILVEYGADLEQIDLGGNNALHYARAFRRNMACNELESAFEMLGLSLEKQNEAGQTPREVAGQGNKIFAPVPKITDDAEDDGKGAEGKNDFK